MKKRTLLIIGAVVVAVIVLSCAGCLILGMFTGSSPTHKATATAQAIIEDTEAVGQETATPTPIPIAPPFEEIRTQMQDMTEAQWNKYTESLKGTRVDNWTGWVEDVNEKTFGGYELWVDMDSPDALLSVYDVSFNIPDDIALQFQKDQPVTFSGQIESIYITLGSLSINLTEVAVEPR